MFGDCRMMWAAGAVAAMSSITFPAISAIVSRNADPDQQGESVIGTEVKDAQKHACCQMSANCGLS